MATHETKSGYILESNDEGKRLSNQHEVIKAAMGGILLRAPVDFTGKGLRVLDSGTADGTWLRDLTTTLTNPHQHTFIGSDINTAEFPSAPPQHTTYIDQDVTHPWPSAHLASFDLVHQRFTLPGAGKFQKLAVQQLAALVKPGGWIQLIEAENIPYPDDGPCMHDFIPFKRAVFTGMGANLRLTTDIPVWLGEVGFTDAQSELFWMELGAANADVELGARGVYSTRRLVEALVPYARGLGDKLVFQESGSDLDGFPEDLGRELKERGGHLPLRVLWAQRPREE